MLLAGQLIWTSVRPLLRLVICTSCGFIITKLDIFPAVAARGLGQIMLNITLPSLMFSKIVNAFDASNISALGPLVLVAILYEVIGMAIAFIVKQFFWVPHRFRYGILVAGGWGNYGDIPTSVIMSITGAAPFNGTEDQNLSVAYVAAFILVFMITLFPLGGHRLIAKDYVGPEVEDDEIRHATRLRRRAMVECFTKPFAFLVRRSSRGGDEEARASSSPKCDPDEKMVERAIGEKQAGSDGAQSPVEEDRPPHPGMGGKHVSFYPDDATTVVASQMHTPAATEYVPSRAPSPEPSVLEVSRTLRERGVPSSPTFSSSSPSPHRRTRTKKVLKHTQSFLSEVLTPASISVILALPIAVVPTLKALFVPVSSVPTIPNAPDGQPPLAFIYDAATFIGAASVPMGLVSLGSALARLGVPKDVRGTVPLGAIGALAVGKVVVMPVLGVVICQGLTRVGVIDEGNRVLRFVCIFFSCLPTATTQVFLTQVYSGTGSADHLSSFLIPQYAIMVVSMVALTAYTLLLLF